MLNLEKVCRMCDNHVVRDQTQCWDASGTNRLPKPLLVPLPFCRHYELHLVWLKQLNEVRGANPDVCRYFLQDGMS